ncbi:hypothetical protein [Bradyrhizobium guangdongense]|uniref:hypothetical protein n=1 Tax=Bradyrhizobium guangdongense TaxID=1325090 RepID=UPI00112D59F3|nr:hypothetical protein [Bradyrhizobium guangdongense]
MAVSDVTARLGPTSQPLRAGQPVDPRPNRFSPLLATLAVLLIVAHAICAVMIVDRALAHAPGAITISASD